jgi:hypothetical protein
VVAPILYATVFYDLRILMPVVLTCSEWHIQGA